MVVASECVVREVPFHLYSVLSAGKETRRLKERRLKSVGATVLFETDCAFCKTHSGRKVNIVQC